MHIEREHNTDKATAIAKLNGFLEELLKKSFPGGVKIQNPQKKWNDGKMLFSFQVKKGWIISINIVGTLDVCNNNVVLKSQIPPIITTFVPKKEITSVINNCFDIIFSA